MGAGIGMKDNKMTHQRIRKIVQMISTVFFYPYHYGLFTHLY